MTKENAELLVRNKILEASRPTAVKHSEHKD